jgi:hypothetical protein
MDGSLLFTSSQLLKLMSFTFSFKIVKNKMLSFRTLFSSTLAPFRNRISTTPTCPFPAAMYNGVYKNDQCQIRHLTTISTSSQHTNCDERRPSHQPIWCWVFSFYPSFLSELLENAKTLRWQGKSHWNQNYVIIPPKFQLVNTKYSAQRRCWETYWNIVREREALTVRRTHSETTPLHHSRSYVKTK